MTNYTTKTAAMTAVIALGALLSGSAHAALLRTSAGVPVLTSDGACVTTEYQGQEQCEAAKLAAGLGGNGSALADGQAHSVQVVVYFDSGKSALTKEAKKSLDALVADMKDHKAKEEAMLKSYEDKEMKDKHHYHHHHKLYQAAGSWCAPSMLQIVGYADPVGKVATNERLAKHRADVVRSYLKAKGLTVKKVEVRSAVVPSSAACPATLPHKKLSDCLHEDRRVEVTVGHQ